MSRLDLTPERLAEFCVRGGRMEDYSPGTLASQPFVQVLAQAIDAGRLSVRRSAGLVGLTIEDLADLFRRHGVAVPFEP